jgi:hypothetical protein
MNCDELRSAMKQGRALTAVEQEHVNECEACLEAWLDATVTQALDAKPEVRIPADFAARVAARLPEQSGTAVQSGRGPYRAHWGLITAIVLVTVGLLVMAVADPVRMNTRMGMILMALLVAEIAGIALWLGCWPHGRTASRGHSRWSWD